MVASLRLTLCLQMLDLNIRLKSNLSIILIKLKFLVTSKSIYLLLLWLMMRWVLLTVRVEFVVRLAVMQTVPVTFSIVPHNKWNSIDDMVYELNDAIRGQIMFAGHV